MVFINRRQRSRFVEDVYLRFTFKNKTQTCLVGDKMCHTRIRLVLYSPCVRVDVYKFVLRYVYAFFFYFDFPPPPSGRPAPDNGVLYTVEKLHGFFFSFWHRVNNCWYFVKITVVLVFPINAVKANTRTLNPF